MQETKMLGIDVWEAQGYSFLYYFGCLCLLIYQCPISGFQLKELQQCGIKCVEDTLQPFGKNRKQFMSDTSGPAVWQPGRSSGSVRGE